MRKSRCTGLAFCALLLALSSVLPACARKIAVRGNLPEPELVIALQPGVSSREDVVRTLGSPSTVSSFESNIWFYIGERTEQTGFLDTEVVDRSVLVVSFQENGIVEDTRLFTIEDGRVINPVTRTTPTEGKELTVLQQIFLNLGRFNSPTDSGRIKSPI